jgi:hypothetical protein
VQRGPARNATAHAVAADSATAGLVSREP